MAEQNTKEGKFRRRSGGAVIGAVTASFFLPPLIAHGTPLLWAFGGVFLGVALLGLYNLAVLPAGQVDPNMKYIIWIAGGLALVTIVVAFVDSGINGFALSSRCKSLQAAMLTGKPQKGETVQPANAHDVFSALGCRAEFNRWVS